MPVLDMFAHIWKDMAGKHFRRQAAASQAPVQLSTKATLVFRQKEDSSRSYHAFPSSRQSGLICARLNPNQEWRVDIQQSDTPPNGTCTCGMFQNNCFPCGHALALIHELHLAPLGFIGSFHKTEAWIATYTHHLPPIIPSDLQIDDSVIPPVEKKRRGRPQKRRKDQGSASALAVLPEDVATVPTDQVAPQEARRARRSHWVYVVDIPSVETPITTRTRSGRV